LHYDGPRSRLESGCAAIWKELAYDKSGLPLEAVTS
jgi:hypothetical protein